MGNSNSNVNAKGRKVIAAKLESASKTGILNLSSQVSLCIVIPYCDFLTELLALLELEIHFIGLEPAHLSCSGFESDIIGHFWKCAIDRISYTSVRFDGIETFDDI